MASTVSSLIDRYAAGPEAVKQAVAGMSRVEQVARPIAGKWSTLEVVCHLADMEAVFAERMKRVIAEDGPKFFDADADRFAAALAYHQRDLSEELAVIENTRRQMTRILRSLSAADFERQGTHSTAGPLTLEKLLANVTAHLAHHVPFILEKRRALGC